ncbi:hypothetical protein AB0F17_38725 [Nonomuraea sp. NPDC026600]|uniref:hypothetical protein n=1 Tax=Nonomuraea sp. NPDC026600 TaxID=3155363 RepID=UPI00340E7E61
MYFKSIAATFAAVVIALAGVPSASAQEPGTTPAAGTESRQWIKLAGTSGQLNDERGAVRLASYSLIFDAGQGSYGYLRKGDKFGKTTYREALVAPGQRWVAGIPDYRLWKAMSKIDLIDRTSRRTYTIALPAPVTSPEWSPDGRTLLLTAYQEHREGSLTIIGFITLNVTDRVPHLVRTGPRHRVTDWAIGRAFRFYFAGQAGGVLAMHEAAEPPSAKSRIAVYGLDGKRRGFYTGVGVFDEGSAVTVSSPSGRFFATVVRKDDKGRDIGIVEASTGKILYRIGGRGIQAFAGWYDDEHVILKQVRGKTQTFQRVDFAGIADLDLIKEKLIAGPAEYKPHLERVNFVPAQG